uniref:ATP synthase complex subunit 8 n=1 Tax=Cucujoidea sp. 39 KM-2017 TaxID=2219377 RepID=A0A346RHB6_9CUCU|nr:ATP synthase F0 subunit 8 [Cucujoidea sp. 39 KM-2017]
MPQMAPLSWLTLYMFFTMIFFMFNIMNYYSFMYSTKSFQMNKKKMTYNWKW